MNAIAPATLPKKTRSPFFSARSGIESSDSRAQVTKFAIQFHSRSIKSGNFTSRKPPFAFVTIPILQGSSVRWNWDWVSLLRSNQDVVARTLTFLLAGPRLLETGDGAP